mmetsp:Transcript_22492/g.43787  ORF Transcript_22492/g.43787 Transcript_22492/m.43787 type:complete len:147 (+) Transcript_22492:99-539(+)
MMSKSSATAASLLNWAEQHNNWSNTSNGRAMATRTTKALLSSGNTALHRKQLPGELRNDDMTIPASVAVPYQLKLPPRWPVMTLVERPCKFNKGERVLAARYCLKGIRNQSVRGSEYQMLPQDFNLICCTSISFDDIAKALPYSVG